MITWPKDFYAHAIRHFNHACEKHPYFADKLEYLNPASRQICLDEAREALKECIECGEVDADTVLECETNEMFLAIGQGKREDAIEEAYDAIAVLMRIICVLEGTQQLGKEERGEDAASTKEVQHG